MIDLAGDVGCPAIRVFGGQIGAGRNGDKLDRQQAIDLASLPPLMPSSIAQSSAV